MYVKFKTSVRDGFKLYQPRLITECTIMNNEKMPVSVGFACLNPTDVHCKVIGQKVALADALRNIPRSVRKQYWDWFFNHSKAAKRLKKK